MNPQEALGLLAQASATYKGTLADHQKIQQAIQVLEVAITPKPDEKAESVAEEAE